MSMRSRRHLYPPDWKVRARTFKEARKWTCEHCGIGQGETRISRRTGLEYSVYLHAAHKRLHETLDPQAELLCLCPSCHGSYDYDLRMRELTLWLEVLKHRACIQRRMHTKMKSVKENRHQ